MSEVRADTSSVKFFISSTYLLVVVRELSLRFYGKKHKAALTIRLMNGIHLL